MDRREFLKVATLSSLSLLVPGTRGWAFNNGKDDQVQKRLIVILLRGGVDGLNIVTPYADQRYYQLRPNIALARPGTELGVLDLDGHFGMHPEMAPLLPLWRNKQLAFVHASGSPDPSRSHFDAQDYMESGVPGNKAVSTGWLNRLVQQLPKKSTPLQAVSIGPVLPRIFSGPATVATIANNIQPSKSVLDTPVIASAFQDLYGNRPDDLGKAFAEGIAARKEVNSALTHHDEDSMDREQMIANKGAPTPGNASQFGKQLAQLFKKSPGLQVAFMDFGGWDTHVNEGTGKGQLANHIKPLANGLGDLVNGMGPMFKDTTIIVMSEFGRTAKENGNHGTDHGHGNVMWLLGGDIAGGKVFARWPGLAPNELHEARDLPTTTDFRTVLSNVLNEQCGISKATIAKVFPDFGNYENPFVQV